ncbi:hypothetical protein P3L10_033647 [Capsicum annuum]
MEIIFTKLHHGGSFSNTGVPTYVASCVPEVRYEAVRGFYYQDAVTNKFKFVKNEPILDPDGPTDFLPAPDIIECADLERESVGVGDSANIERESVGVEEERKADVEDVGVQGGDEANVEDIHVEDISLEDFGVEGGDEADAEDINVEDVNRLISELSDYLSSDSDLGDIPSEDGSDVDEELRAFRQERREKKPTTKKARKKVVETEEVPVGVAGCVDRGFGDIGKSKATKYSEKLGGDEEYIDSFDCWSEDSEEIDVDVVRGVDLPRRRRSNKTRYDENCEFSAFELRMIFAGANQFRKVVADYAVEYRRQVKLKPNEKYRIRVKCIATGCCLLLLIGIQDLIVMRENMGDWKLKFARLYNYADMIKTINPRSSCWIKIDKETETRKNLFVYFFVCFYAFNQGWLDGCRRIIDFDGCFLKEACKVVDTKTKHIWDWFIRYLIADLNLGTGEGLTVMSDQQKGLVPVLMYLLPNAERRMCARHI